MHTRSSWEIIDSIRRSRTLISASEQKVTINGKRDTEQAQLMEQFEQLSIMRESNLMFREQSGRPHRDGQACQAGREPPDAELEGGFPLDVLQVVRVEDAVVGYSVCLEQNTPEDSEEDPWAALDTFASSPALVVPPEHAISPIPKLENSQGMNIGWGMNYGPSGVDEVLVQAIVGAESGLPFVVLSDADAPVSVFQINLCELLHSREVGQGTAFLLIEEDWGPTCALSNYEINL
ncbi:hypothetical protein PROFUN_14293 [Planoprotostelium fungivorum]|uniref:Uncharacterized protein n=1 Tax=Planoprotostelium fungivorum TaxID=1890364 RepID=A0A2P6N0K3_9EUKA|nr:hypothetical protein PROFUN_14293 [Planoprotostelium fungivorum]